MRTVTEQRTCEVNSPGEVQNAVIADSPEMFSILYSKLYSRKEMAIVRELLANAWDAHLRAGTTATPIKIHLPTPLEPWFEIRDFGTGLTAEGVETLFMNYGFTDKNETDDEIGGMGLGSKAPYCYTDQFTVISYKDGWAYIYQAFLQSNGKPACTQLDKYPTNEANGLVVRVNVADEGRSQQRFIDAMRELYPYLPTAPTINSQEAEWVPPEYRLETPVAGDEPLYHLAVGTGKRMLFNNTVTFVQGIVPYAVDLSNLMEELRTLPSELQRLIEHTPFTLWVDIGTLPVTASREGLELNPQAKSKIAVLLRQAAETAKAKFEELLETATTWYEWAQAANSAPMRAAVPQRFMDLTTSAGTLKAKALGIDTAQIESAIRVRPTREVKDGFRRHYEEFLGVDRIEDVTLYVQKKSGWPLKRFITERHLPNVGGEALVLIGEIEHIRKQCRRLGIPNPVHEVEYIRAQPGERKKRQGQGLGAAKYYSQRIYQDSQSNWQHQLGETTAGDFLDNVDANTLVRLPSSTSDRTADTLMELLQAGILTCHKPIHILHVQDKHTRVRKALTDQLQQQLIPSHQYWDHADLIVDQHQMARYAAALYAYTQIRELMNGIISLRGARTMLRGLDAGTTVLHKLRDAYDEAERYAALSQWGAGFESIADAVNTLPDKFRLGMQIADRRDIETLLSNIKTHAQELQRVAPGVDKYLHTERAWRHGDAIVADLVKQIAALLPEYDPSQGGNPS